MLEKAFDRLGGITMLICLGSFALIQGIAGIWFLNSYELNMATRIIFVVIGIGLGTWGLWLIMIQIQESKKERIQFKDRKTIWFIVGALIVISSSILYICLDNNIQIENGLPKKSESPISIPTETLESQLTEQFSYTETLPDIATRSAIAPITKIPQNSGEMDIVSFVVAYYETINNAGNKQDIESTLLYLAPNLRYSNDVEYWWGLQVKYNIYQCSENIVYVDWTVFIRGNSYTTLQNKGVVKYVLDVVNNEWEFQTGDDAVVSVSSNCDFAATNWTDD